MSRRPDRTRDQLRAARRGSSPARIDEMESSSRLTSIDDLLDLAGAPGAVEPRIEWAVETKKDEPAVAGKGLDDRRSIGRSCHHRDWVCLLRTVRRTASVPAPGHAACRPRSCLACSARRENSPAAGHRTPRSAPLHRARSVRGRPDALSAGISGSSAAVPWSGPRPHRPRSRGRRQPAGRAARAASASRSRAASVKRPRCSATIDTPTRWWRTDATSPQRSV